MTLSPPGWTARRRVFRFGRILMIALLCAVVGGLSGCGGHDFSAPSSTAFANRVVFGEHLLPQGAVTPVEFRLENPQRLNTLRFRVLYDATQVEIVNPALLPGRPKESAGSVFGEDDPLYLLDYECDLPPNAAGQKGILLSLAPAPNGPHAPLPAAGTLVTLYFRPAPGAPVGAQSVLLHDNLTPTTLGLDLGSGAEPSSGTFTVGRLTLGPSGGSPSPLPEGQSACADSSGPPPVTGDTNLVLLGNHRINRSAITSVSLTLLNPANISGVQARLLYDSTLFEAVDTNGTALEGTEAANSVIRNAYISVNYEVVSGIPGKGAITFALSGPRPTSQSGLLLTLYFRARSFAAPGASAPFYPDPAFNQAFAAGSGWSAFGRFEPGTLTVAP